jgi:hypothetical protein
MAKTANFADTEVITAAKLNSMLNDDDNWAAHKNAGGFNLSALGVLTFAAGGYINSDLGIKTATPGARLSLGSPIQTNALYVFEQPGAAKYGLGIGSYQLQIYSGAEAATSIALGTYDGTTFTAKMTIASSGIVTHVGTPVYADNAAAIAGGLTAGMQYRTAAGVRMEVF